MPDLCIKFPLESWHPHAGPNLDYSRVFVVPTLSSERSGFLDSVRSGFRADRIAIAIPRTRASGAPLQEHTVRNVVSYLRGKEDLFNDMFTGGSGRFLYEEMPAESRKSGLAGRVLDATLKVFGI
jgi:hypothetical protein